MTALTTRAFWDASAGSKAYPSKWSRPDCELMRVLRPVLEEKRGGKLIEMGCGNSYWLPWFAKEFGMDVSGIEYSHPRLVQAVNNLNRIQKHGSLALRDFTLPNASWNHSFDVLVSFGVIEHFENPSKIVRTFAQYLSPDGLMVTTVPYLKGTWGRISERISPKATAGFRRMDLHDLERAHKDAGLKVVSSSYFRWCDMSVLNFGELGRVSRFLAYGTVEALNLVLREVKPATGLSEDLYSDMVVIAK